MYTLGQQEGSSRPSPDLKGSVHQQYPRWNVAKRAPENCLEAPIHLLPGCWRRGSALVRRRGQTKQKHQSLLTAKWLAKSECNSSTATSKPFQQVLDVLLKQQKSIEDMVKAMNNLKTVEHNPIKNKPLRNQPSSSCGNCYNSGKPNHIARYCRSRPVVQEPPAQGQVMDKKTEQSQLSNYHPLPW